jgi:hypothetical protein
MQHLKIVLTSAAMIALALVLVGCGGDDSPTAPQGDTLTVDSAMAEDITLQALDVVNNMVTEIPAIASGSFDSWTMAKAEFAKANTDSVVWDPAQNAWVFSYAGPLFELEAPSYWNMSLELWVQYRNAQGPMQFPLGATEMEMNYGLGMDMHLVEGESSADMNYDMNTEMVVSYLGEGGSYGVVGSGATVVEMAEVGPQASQSGRFSMAWSLDVAVSEAGCPLGTATINTQQWEMIATYDGQGNVAWVLTGPDYQGAGTDVVGCGQPAF